MLYNKRKTQPIITLLIRKGNRTGSVARRERHKSAKPHRLRLRVRVTPDATVSR